MRYQLLTSALLVGWASCVALTGCESDAVIDDQRLYEENIGPAGSDASSFERYDADGDGMISEQEFRGIYQSWDINKDGMISEDEFRF